MNYLKDHPHQPPGADPVLASDLCTLVYFWIGQSRSCNHPIFQEREIRQKST